MPVFIAPGVYVEVLDLSLYIPNLSTTRAGFVGMASKGPLNDAVFISGVLDFVTNFGSPNPNYFGPYAALQFLRYGRQAYYVRVAGDSAANAQATLYEQTTAASITAGVAGPYLVKTSDDSTLRLKLNADSGFLAISLTKGVRTASQVAANILAAILGAGGSHAVTVTATAGGAIKIASTTLGTTSKVIIDSVSNGSTANALLGFPTGGLEVDGVNATAGVVTGAGVTSPYTIVTSSNDTVIVSIDGEDAVTTTLTAGSRTAAQIAAEIQTAIDVAGTAAAVTVGGNTVVRITSASTGSTSSVLVLDTAGAATLGLDIALHRGMAATPATQTGTAIGPFTVGKNNILDLRFNGGNLRSIAFLAGLKTATAVAAAINVVIGPNGFNEGIATVTHDGKVQISTLAVGATSSVQADSAGSGQYLMNLSTSEVDGTGTANNPTLIVTALTPGTYGNDLKVVISAGHTANTFKLVVYSGQVKQEVWDNLVKDSASASFVESVNEKSTWIQVADQSGSSVFPEVASTFLTGGDDGLNVSDADYIGSTVPGSKTGLQLYANAKDLDLNLVLIPGISSPAVLNEMILLCQTRGDCMAILDPPLGLSVQQVVDWHNGYGAYSDHQAFNDRCAALYWPWMQVYDATNAQTIWVPPSGLVAAVYAYTDTTTETWYAPAGLNRGHLIQPLQLEHNSDDGEIELMYGSPNAVNPIIKFRNDGITVWGQRTLQRKPSALDRVNVERLVLYLGKVIASAAKYLVFEPNDPILWAQLTNIVEPYLESVKQRRGLVEFKVLCDANTNPPDALDRNEMHAIIALKPTKSAEFIDLKFVITPQGTNFSDLNSLNIA